MTLNRRDDVGRLLPAWRELYRRAGAWSPFSDPDYQLAWCSAFVEPGRELIVGIWRDDGQELVAVAPLFEASVGVGRARISSLHVFGSLYEPMLHELPELLLEPGCARAALAFAVRWLVGNVAWDWLELPLHQDQPWFEPRWATDAGLERGLVLHKHVRSMVTLELPEPGETLPLKRNLKESLRRTRNRANRELGDWTVRRCSPPGPEWTLALTTLETLHCSRARIDGRPPHGNIFDGTSQARLLRALSATDSGTHPVIYQFDARCATIASLLTINSPTTTWITVSGLLPRYWRLGAVTFLQSEAVRDAIAGGREVTVFAPGVDTAKLRWSENVRVSNLFALVRPSRRSLAAFRAYWVASAWRTVLRETHRGDVGGA